MSFLPDTLTGFEIARAIKAKQVSARAVVEATLEQVDLRNPSLNAFTLVTRERALSEADAIDSAIANGRAVGPLAGVPFAVKNLFDLAGEVTVAGSKINRDDPPANRDATAVRRLVRAGAICIGALNMGEYAYDFITNNPHDGPTRNPHDPERSAGGSSGGSGSAVAAGLVSIALGTDTNGSIRVPASFSGVWGLRPTYGTLSRGGSFAFVDSLDTIGPLARSPRDLALAYDAMHGSDLRDKAYSQNRYTPLAPQLDLPTDSLRIAELGGYFASGGEARVHEAVSAVSAALGANSKIELPESKLARTAAYLITASESAVRHRDRLRDRACDFDPVIRDRLFSGSLIPAAWYLEAQRFRAWWQERIAEIFQTVDALIAPATPLRAPRFGEESFTFAGQEIPLRPNIGVFTQPLSLVGLPIVAAPVHFPGELPCAVQLIGPPNSEGRLLALARRLEESGVCRCPAITERALTDLTR